MHLAMSNGRECSGQMAVYWGATKPREPRAKLRREQRPKNVVALENDYGSITPIAPKCLLLVRGTSRVNIK